MKSKNFTYPKEEEINEFFAYSYIEGYTDSMYPHWSENLNMVIIKDGVAIKLNSNEISALVKQLPKTVGGVYS